MTSEQEEKQLRALLSEDFGDEADRYLPVVRALRRQPEPIVQHDETTRMAKRLRAQFAAPKRWRMWFPVVLMRAELNLVRFELWLASALIMLLGVIVTQATFDPRSSIPIPFIHIAPVMAALSVAIVFNPNTDPPYEIMLACAHSVRTVLLARLTLIFSANLLFGVTGSLFLVFTHAELSLWPLVATWLAPMTFLSALALFLAIVFKEPLVGAVVSLILWIWQHIDLPAFLRMPITILAADRTVLMLLALVLGGIAIWLAGNNERWLGATQ